MKQINGKTGLLGLIGSPVGHSGSPAMYNCSFEKLGLDYVYLAFDVTTERTGNAIAAMRTLNMRGMNVTMPCKTEAVRYMDELSLAAQITGSVNTIVNDNGKLTGYITDGIGFVKNLQDHQIDISGKKLTVLGAGGAATAIFVQCALDNASQISIFNVKDPFFNRALQTMDKLRSAAPNCAVEVFDLNNLDLLKKEISQCDILVNATLVGMKPNEGVSPISDISVLRKDLIVADVIYNPLETRLLREAREVGCTCINGIGVLLWQGAESFRLYTGLEMPMKEVKELFN